jgi:hypothetical protein
MFFKVIDCKMSSKGFHMKIIKSIVLLSFLIIHSNTTLNADNQSAKYFGSREYQQQLYNLGVHWDRNVLQLQSKCTSKYTIKPISFAIIKPLKFSFPKISPIEGAWTFRYKLTRCNNSIIYNSFNIAKNNQKPKTIPLVPGTTNCSIILLKDVMQAVYANLALNNNKKNNTTCKNPNVLNTEVTMPQSSKNNIWEEKWTIKECDINREILFCFTPTKGGGTDWSTGGCKK